MAPEIPVRTVSVTLKQIVAEDLNATGLAAAEACFTGSTEPLKPDGEYARRGRDLAAAKFGALGLPHESDLSPNRRFAGDRSLGRGRYFAVCRDGSGDDDGTLVRELTAYYNPLKSGLVIISDPRLPEGAHLVPKQVAQSGDLLLSFPPVGGRPHPFTARYTDSARPMVVTLPTRIVQDEIDGLIDLRQPDVAAWFTAGLSRITTVGSQRTFPFKPPLDSFSELLPSLLCQSIGGGRGPVQVAGLWLRRLGVNGLIFPSARSDARVEVLDGKVVEATGFNFVDYRNAGEPEYSFIIDFSIGWPQAVQTWPDDYIEGGEPVVYNTVKIRHEASGSWRIEGLQIRRDASLRFLEAVWLMRQLIGVDDPDVRTVTGFLYDFTQKTWRPELAHNVVYALLGLPEPRTKILQFLDRAMFDSDPQIRASVRRVMDKAPATQVS